MKFMYDSVNAHNLPLGADYYAGYVAGNWPNFIEISKMFPKKRVVSIAVQADQNAQVLDVERGDATADQVPAWVVRMRKTGRKRPTIYTSRSNYPEICAALDAAKVAHPDFWIADWTGEPHAIPNAVAVQYLSTDLFDKTCITDAYWPNPKPHLPMRIVHKALKPVHKVVKKVAKVVALRKIKRAVRKKS